MFKVIDRHKFGLASALALALALPQVGLAQEQSVPKAQLVDEETLGSFSAQIENDILQGSDRHYTNGIRLSYVTPATETPAFLRSLSQTVPMFEPGSEIRGAFHISQTMYTPENTDVTFLVEDDRPYAGWLHAGFGLFSEYDNRMDSFEVDLGVVGPLSLAEQTQIWWHDVIGVNRPNGWENQLDNEPTLQFTGERKWRNVFADADTGLGFDVSPHIGAALGNVHIYGAGGVTLRFGQDLTSDYGAPRIRPSLPGSTYFSSNDGFGWYLFAGAEGRAIARNMFLDGNSFTSSHSVDKEYFVGDFQAGFAVTFGNARLAYTQVYRTKEFEQQREEDRFGAVTLGVRF